MVQDRRRTSSGPAENTIEVWKPRELRIDRPQDGKAPEDEGRTSLRIGLALIVDTMMNRSRR
ncbi:hypothetical protein HOG48_01405 [Candidatus Peregrinibacteria bacterium]|jgi:hypothetical protein|nr:hypothetical protein [Candidatus Peregrinibacteria bacterium]